MGVTPPKPAAAPARTVRVITMPVWTVAVSIFTVLILCAATYFVSVAIADRNADRLIDRYEADKQATAEANRQVTCELFASQLDAFEDATSPAGKKSRAAWFKLYVLARCQPVRK